MEKRFIEIKGGIYFKTYNSNDWELTLQIKHKDLAAFLLEMLLLEYRHVQELTVQSNASSKKIALTVSENIQVKETHVDKLKDKFKVSLSFNDLQYIASFLLKYYRDTVAPVDHIHIDVDKSIGLESAGTVTISVENSAEPISEDETKKLLGLGKR